MPVADTSGHQVELAVHLVARACLDPEAGSSADSREAVRQRSVALPKRLNRYPDTEEV